MKRNVPFFISYWLPIVITAGIIFIASSQPYHEQDLRPSLSERFDLEFIEVAFQDVEFTYSDSVVSISTRGVDGFVEFFIRKGAHFGVFFILGFFCYRLFRAYSTPQWKSIFYSLVFVIVYASLDEFHQSLTPNRTPLVADVILDTIGGIVGITIAYLIYRRRTLVKT
ncbi:VanZ family protein [Alkalihalobacillus sp. BA299]|uniref:VanZ family protein n=1 Tax=Alkalihalobacillus sp. BA299 TaxID=2815938 RepID=UPI001ADCB3AB|nr:VanZ family protein [Alkalihalobacillus sp. BA299]